jgi:hypothetical protein
MHRLSSAAKMKNFLPFCAALFALAGAIIFHAANGKYAFVYSGGFTYAKMNTRTGEAWLCGAELDQCLPITSKAAFLAYAGHFDPADQLDQLSRAGFSDDEIKEWISKRIAQPSQK